MIPFWFWGWLRGWVLVLAGLAAFAYFVGVPHMLTTYEYRGRRAGPVYTRCNYLGPFGIKRAWPGDDVPEDCPVFVLLKWNFEGRP